MLTTYTSKCKYNSYGIPLQTNNSNNKNFRVLKHQGSENIINICRLFILSIIMNTEMRLVSDVCVTEI